jgi:hypothetical protein
VVVEGKYGTELIMDADWDFEFSYRCSLLTYLLIGVTFESYLELRKEDVVRMVLKIWVIHPRIEGRIS